MSTVALKAADSETETRNYESTVNLALVGVQDIHSYETEAGLRLLALALELEQRQSDIFWHLTWHPPSKAVYACVMPVLSWITSADVACRVREDSILDTPEGGLETERNAELALMDTCQHKNETGCLPLPLVSFYF